MLFLTVASIQAHYHYPSSSLAQQNMYVKIAILGETKTTKQKIGLSMIFGLIGLIAIL